MLLPVDKTVSLLSALKKNVMLNYKSIIYTTQRVSLFSMIASLKRVYNHSHMITQVGQDGLMSD